MSDVVYSSGFLNPIELPAAAGIMLDHYGAAYVFLGNSDVTRTCP